MTTQTLPEPEESRVATPAPAFTWQSIAGQWLHASATKDTDDTQALARRLAAVQRWRGLPPEDSTCRL